ncbi:MAG TPA: leucine-rich repeat domain-containing protein [Spirochaetota bacterium]|nr:leucine-rich repeat domain-containing protein [Spirochaetota bacterium]
MNISIFRLILNIVRTGSIATNLALSGYLFFLHEFVYDWFFYDTVQEISSDILHHGGTNPVLGITLFLAVAGEMYAFILKTRHCNISAKEGGGVFLLWMFHTVISVIMTIIAMGAFGITFDSGSGLWLLTAMLFGTVIKELVILGIIVTGSEKRKPSKSKSMLADFLFLLFYSLAYTIVIGNILKPNDYNNYLLASYYSTPLIIMNTFIVLLLFFMLYLPLRMPYFIFENYESGKEKVLGAVSILLVAAAAVLPLFEGEVSLERALKNPREVEVLFLNSRELNEVPGEVQNLKNLRVLHLGFNRLSDLPPWINKLERLEWIGLGGNRFEEVPEELLTLPRMKEIDIHYNRIQRLPEDLSPFRKLRSLNLRSNMILQREKERIRKELRVKGDGPSLVL